MERRTYIKIPCKDCGSSIGRNVWAIHLRSCKNYLKRIELERATSLQSKPIELMTLKELEDSNRLDEAKEYLKQRQELL